MQQMNIKTYRYKSNEMCSNEKTLFVVVEQQYANDD